jgi:beta-lactamase superfamily II metal-dependent hydrolase
MKRIVIATVGMWLASLTLVTSVWAGKADGRLDIYWVDVEGGAATLIVTPQGESVLIDTGNPGIRDPDRIVQVATRVAKIRSIDHLIVTHYHRDHYGGAATLATLLPIGTVHDNGRFKDMPDDPGKAYFTFKCKDRKVIRPGDVVPLKQSATKLQLQCLVAQKKFVAAAAGATANAEICADVRSKNRDGSDNANSVVVKLDFGGFRFFDAGDLTWNQETRLVCPVNLVGTVDVYQVTHHGLDSSNNPLVLRSLQPRVAIMNNGVTKGCAPEVFANLKATASIQAIYQMHKNLRPDGAANNTADGYIANLEKDCRANFIKLSVDPTGSSYQVSIPGRDHQKTFQSRTK